MKKMRTVLIIWISIFPPLTLILWAFRESLNSLPLILRTFILTLILVPLMVYLLVPFWTKVIAAIESSFSKKDRE